MSDTLQDLLLHADPGRVEQGVALHESLQDEDPLNGWLLGRVRAPERVLEVLEQTGVPAQVDITAPPPVFATLRASIGVSRCEAEPQTVPTMTIATHEPGASWTLKAAMHHHGPPTWLGFEAALPGGQLRWGSLITPGVIALYDPKGWRLRFRGSDRVEEAWAPAVLLEPL